MLKLEREPSVLCHGCWGTPPFELNYPVSLPSSIPPPTGSPLLWLVWIQSPSCIRATLGYQVTQSSFPRLSRPIFFIALFSFFLSSVFRSDCPCPDFNGQLYACTCPSPLQFTFPPNGQPDNQAGCI